MNCVSFTHFGELVVSRVPLYIWWGMGFTNVTRGYHSNLVKNAMLIMTYPMTLVTCCVNLSVVCVCVSV